jgi:DDE superfamily endonuclease
LRAQPERTIARGSVLARMHEPTRIAPRAEVRSRAPRLPAFAALVEPFRAGFHPQVVAILPALGAGGLPCLGPRSRGVVGPASGLAAPRPHDTAGAVFPAAAWEWDDLGRVLATLILAWWVPGGAVGIVVDETLGPRRGVPVARGGLVRDAAWFSRRHQTLRFGVNGVELGIVAWLPFRPDRAGSQTRPQAAAAWAWRWAGADPGRTVGLVGARAHVNAAARRGAAGRRAAR